MRTTGWAVRSLGSSFGNWLSHLLSPCLSTGFVHKLAAAINNFENGNKNAAGEESDCKCSREFVKLDDVNIGGSCGKWANAAYDWCFVDLKTCTDPHLFAAGRGLGLRLRVAWRGF